jgi:transposase
MLRMDQVHVVRHKVLVEGQQIRRVAREMGIARNTVRKYLAQAAPARVEEAPRARPVWEKVGPRLEALLAESPRWTGGKQRLTAARLHAMLVAEGYSVGITTVKEAVVEWKRRRREVFVPLTYPAGDLAEVDFFEVLVDLAGKRAKAWMTHHGVIAESITPPADANRCSGAALGGQRTAGRDGGGSPVLDRRSAPWTSHRPRPHGRSHAAHRSPANPAAPAGASSAPRGSYRSSHERSICSPRQRLQTGRLFASRLRVRADRARCKVLVLDPEALRARCRRAARKEGRDVVAYLGGGVTAFKLGRSWRVRFPAA